MKITTVISHEYLDGVDLDNKTIVVIDTLRATSVITSAYCNGAKSIRMVKEPNDAFLLREELLKNKEDSEGNESYNKENDKDKSYKNKIENNILLGGEREAKLIPGFDLSNSPLEYTKDRVFNKDIIMTTSNGTKTMIKIGRDKKILIASLLNVRAVSNKIKDLNKDVVIVNAGTNGQLSLEDFITGGAIASYFKVEDLCDTTLASIASFESLNILDYIKKSKHYNRIKDLGYDKDLEYCFKLDLLSEVPIVENFVIKKI